MAPSSWFRWLRTLLPVQTKTKNKSKSKVRRRDRRPALEHLETRLAPATFTWQGGFSNNVWSDPRNWTSSVPNTAPSTASGAVNDLIFSASSSHLSTTDNIAGLNVNSITISGNSYSILGTAGALSLGNAIAGGGTILVNAGATNETMSVPLALNGVGASGALDTITVGAGAALTLNGTIGQLSSPGAATLTKSGAGSLTLTTDNSGTFNGAIDVTGGVLAITNPNALGNVNAVTNHTTVEANAQLQVNNAALAPTFVVHETLKLNGPGINSAGALLNVAGIQNIWAGPITLDVQGGPLVSLGASAGSVLNITGLITDGGAGQNVTKEGAGQIIFSHVGGNTYRGSTTVDNGILTITDPKALGSATVTDSTGQTGVIVNSNPTTNTTGTLQLAQPFTAGQAPLNGIVALPSLPIVPDPTTGQAGFIVRGIPLTVNGVGFNSQGALENLTGNNTWTGNVTIGGLIPKGEVPTISVDATTIGGVTTYSNLLLSGVLHDEPLSVNSAIFPLIKNGPGRLVLSNVNTYTGSTLVLQGELNVEDSQALGLAGKTNPTIVAAGASLELELQKDDIFNFFSSSPNVPAPKVDSLTGTLNNLQFTDNLILNGTGVPVANSAVPDLTSPFVTATVAASAPATIAASPGGAKETASTVTITTTAAHNFAVGQAVTIAGVGVAGYNGTFTITAVTATTFSYTDAATGLAASGGGSATPVTTGAAEVGSTVTIRTTAPHGFTVGEIAVVSGVGVAGYNGTFTITGVTANTFTYTDSVTGLAASGGGIVKEGPGLAGGSLNFSSNAIGSGTGALHSISGINTWTGNGTVPGSGTGNITLATTTNSLAASDSVAVAPGGATEVGETVTITVAGAQNFLPGTTIVVSGVAVAGYNGIFTIASATGASFTYTDNATGLAPSGGGTAIAATSAEAIGLTNLDSIDVEAPGVSGPLETADNTYFTKDYSLTIGPNAFGDGGVVSGAGVDLQKTGTGQLILPAANTYTGLREQVQTDIQQGWITAQNDSSLGLDGAASTPTGSVTSAPNFTLAEMIPIVINTPTTAGLTNGDTVIVTGETGNISANGIWTITDITPTTFTLVGSNGTALLPATGPLAGSINAFDTGGGTWTRATVNPTADPYVVVENGAALHLKPLTATGNLNLSNNMVLSGTGITHAFGGPNGISQQGALLNLSGVNTLSGNLQFDGSAGIGVQELGPNPESQLTLTGPMADYSPSLPFTPTLLNPPAVLQPDGTTDGGIVKLGTERLIIQGPGSYHGAVDIQAGVILDQNDTGLGLGVDPSTGKNVTTNTVTVEAGAALELSNTIATENGGISDGVQIMGSELILNGTGNSHFGDTSPLVILPATPVVVPSTAPIGESNIATDDMWGGPVSIDQTIVLTFPTNAVQPIITANNKLTGTGTTSMRIAPTTVGGGALNTVEEITFSSNVTGGSFTLSLDGVNFTTPIAWDPGTGPDAGDLATRIQAALNALTVAPNVTVAAAGASVNVPANERMNFWGNIDDAASPFLGGADLTFTGGDASAGAGEVTLAGVNTFHGTTTVSPNIVLVVENGQALGSTGLSSSDAVLNATQTLDLTNLIAGGTFTLSFNGSVPTTALSLTGVAATDAKTIQARLQALSTIGGAANLGGVVTVTSTNDKTFTITFSGTLAAFSQPNVVVAVTPAAPATIGASPLGAVEVGSTVTITTTAAHNFVVGQTVTISGVGVAGYNGTFTIATVSATKFSYNLPISGLAASGGGTAALVTPTVTTVVNGGGGTVVAKGASLELQGDINVAGEPLLLEGGTGVSSTPNIPQQFFAVGPSPATKTAIAGAGNSTGRVTGVAVDPLDPNVIYVATAGGGAWKSTDSGNTWHPIFDDVTNANKVGLPQGTAALYAGAIAIDPIDHNTIYLGTGESDSSADSFYGTGVYQSTNGGQTWTLLADLPIAVKGNNPLLGQAISKIVVDRLNGVNEVFAASSNIDVGNGATGTVAGIFRFNLGATGDAVGTWVNLTAQPDIIRISQAGQAPFTFPPSTPGPDDDFRFQFPTLDTGLVFPTSPLGRWSDLALDARGTLYAALGTPGGDIDNAVFRTANPTFGTGLPGSVPSWLIGDPGPKVDQVETVTVTGATFKLSFNGFTTPAIPAGSSALVVATFLDDLPSIGGLLNHGGDPGEVEVVAIFTGPVITGYTITFGTPVPLFYPPFGPFVPAGSGPANPAETVVQGDPGFGPGGVWTWSPPQPDVPLPNALSGVPVSLLGVPGGGATVVITTPGSGIDTRSGNEFPGGNFTTGIPRNADIKIAVVSDPQDPNKDTVYAAITDPGILDLKPGTLLEIQESTTGGLAWAPMVVQPPNYQGQSQIPLPFSGQGDYDSTITATAQFVYVGGQELLPPVGAAHTFHVLQFSVQSSKWTDISIDTLGNGPHTDDHAMALDNQGRLILGSDGGVFRWDNTTQEWADINGNLASLTVDGIATDPTNKNIILIGTQDNGIDLTTGSPAWAEVSSGGDGGPVAIDPQDPQIMFANDAVNGVLSETVNSGADHFATQLSGGVLTFTLDQINPQRLVASIGGFVEESNNDGATFTNLLDLLPNAIFGVAVAQYQGPFVADPGFPLVPDLGTDTYDPNTIYAFDIGEPSPSSFTSINSGVEVTKDDAQLNAVTGLTDWDIRETGLPIAAAATDPFANSTFSDIEVDPRNRDIALVTDSSAPGNDAASSANGRVFMTTNAGLSWTNITGSGAVATSTTFGALPDVPAWKLVVDPRTNDVYVGTDQGVFVSTNALSGGVGTTTWLRLGAGMPEVQVDAMDLNATTNILTVGTYGRSVYQLPLDGTLVNPADPTQGINTGAVIAVSGSSAWSGPVIFGSATTVGTEGTQDLQNGLSAASLTISGTISDLTSAGSNTLTKVGQGNLILSGSNIYAGVTDIQDGVVVAQNSNALGLSTDNTIVEAGAALQVTTNLDVNLTLNGSGFSFDGHPTGALRNTSHNNTYTGTITLATASTIGTDSGTSLTINGVITGGNSSILTKEGSGILVLQGADTYTANTNVDRGVLVVENNSALGLGTATTTTVRDGAQLQLQNPLEVQTLTLPADLVPGVSKFTVSFNGGTSAPILYSGTSSDAAVVQTALNALTTGIANIGGAVDVFGDAGVFSIFFTGNLGGVHDPLVTATVTVSGIGGPAVGTVATAFENVAGQPGINLGLPGQIIDLSGTGIFGSGALVSVSGVNTISGPIKLDEVPGFAPATSPGPIVPISVLSTSEAGSIASFLLFPAPAGSLTLDGTISEQNAGQGIDKIGSGVLILDDSNTYTGTTTVTTGILRIQQATALQNSSSTIVTDGAELQLDLDPTHTGTAQTVSRSSLVLSGTGINNGGALENLSGLDSWTGPITIADNTTIGVNQSTVQNVTVTGGSGTFALTFTNALGVSKSTGQLPFNATALQVANALNGLTNIPAGGVISVIATPVTVPSAGIVYTVTFGGTMDTTNQLPLVASVLNGAIAVVDAVKTGNAVSSLTLDPAAGIADSLGTSSLTKVGTGTLFLPAPNSYGGQTLVDAGILDISDPGALGTNPNTTVANGASLELSATAGNNFSVVNGTLTINGNGFTPVVVPALPALPFFAGPLGALENLNGDNTWNTTAPITMASNSSVGAQGGSLTIISPITDNGSNFTLTKFGAGTVVESGTQANAYTGLTTVADGVLVLDKSGGALAVLGNLTIGDGGATDPLQSDVAQLGGSNEIDNTATVTVLSDGLFDLGDQTQTIQTLNMAGGTVSLTGVTSQLTLTGNVTARPDTAATPNPATITGAGTLNLAPTSGLATTVTVAAGSNPPDMVINAVITGTGVGLTKTGPGTLQLTANEAYSGPTTINAGTVQVDGSVNVVNLNGGTLSGDGTVGLVSDISGTIDPGDNAPGLLTVVPGSVNVTLNAQTTYNEVLGGTVPAQSGLSGTGFYSQLDVAGNLDLGNARLTGQLFGSFSAAVNDPPYVIIQTTGGGVLSGLLSDSSGHVLADGASVFVGGQKFTIHYTLGANGFVELDPVLSSVTVSLTSSLPAGSTYGQDVTFTATVTPQLGAALIPTGVVQFTLTDHNQPTFPPLNLFISASTTSGVSSLFTADFEAPANFDLTLTPDLYDIQAVYTSTNNYAAPSLPATFQQNITKDGTSISNVVAGPASPVIGQTVTVTATISPAPNAPNSPNAALPGEVIGTQAATFTIDNNAPVTADVVNGVAQITLNSLAIGPHTVKVSYVGDSNYTGSNNNANLFRFTVNKDNVNLTSTSPNGTNDPAFFGQSVPFTEAVAAQHSSIIPGGFVTFHLGTATGTAVTGGFDVPVLGGIASFNESTLAVGTYTIVPTYTGDGNFQTATGPSFTFTVIADPTNGAVVANPNPATTTSPVKLTANISNGAPGVAVIPTGGTVTFTDGATTLGTAPLVNGVATLNPGGIYNGLFTLGSHTIVATYSGAGNFASSSAVGSTPGSVVLSVGTGTSVTNVTANPTSIQFGSSVTFSAKVTSTVGVPNGGTVTFMLDNSSTGTVLGSANIPIDTTTGAVTTGVITSTALTPGTHTIFAVYSGFTPFNSSIGQVSFLVTKAAPGNVVTATVNGSPATSATFGTFTETFIDTLTGVNGISPTGTVNFAGLTGQTGTTGVALVAGPAGSGTATATFTTATPTSLAGGNYSVVATYLPGSDPDYASDAATPFAFTVDRAGTTTTVTPLSFSSIVFGQPVTLTATVASPGGVAPTVNEGTVTFTGPNGFSSGPVNVVNGTATFTTTGNGAKEIQVGSGETITATYDDSTGQDFTVSLDNTTITNFTVTQASTAVTLVGFSVDPVGKSQALGISATVTNTSGVSTVAPTGGTVTFFDVNHGNANLGSATLVNGTATLNFAGFTTIGTHGIDAVYNGSNNFSFSSPSSTFNETVVTFGTTSSLALETASPVFGKPLTLQSTTTPSSGGAFTSTAGLNVTFLDTTTSTTLGHGTLSVVAGRLIATFTTSAPLSVGTHVIQALFTGNSNFGASFANLSIVVTKSGTTTTLTSSNANATIGAPVTLTATVAGAFPVSGTPPTGTVTFKIGSTVLTGTVTTSTVGGSLVVKLTTTAIPSGTQTITATYAPGSDPDYLASAGTVLQSTQPPATHLSATVTTTQGTSPGDKFSIAVAALNAQNNRVTNFSGATATFTFTPPSGGSITGSRSATFSGGVATFSGLSFTKLGKYTITITVAGLPPLVISITSSNGNIVG